MTRRVAFLHGVHSRTFPRFTGTINTLRLPAARLAALRCLRLAIPRFHLIGSIPDGPSDTSPSLELVTRYLRPGFTGETTGSPSFLGNLQCAFALLSDPGRINAPDRYSAPTWPPLCPQRRLPPCTFEAQSHSFGTHCLRFAGRVTPTPRKTRFRLRVRHYRTGLITRKVPPKGFKLTSCSSSSFPKLSWRKDILLFVVSKRAFFNTLHFLPHQVRPMVKGDASFVESFVAPDFGSVAIDALFLPRLEG